MSALHDAIHDAVRAIEPEAIDLLRAMIRTPSVTGDEGDHEDPATVAGLLYASLDGRPGIRREGDRVEPGRSNVIALLPGAPGGVFALDAHVDTVPAGDPAAWVNGNPFSAQDGTVTYLGHDRVRLEVGDLRLERQIRRRLGRLWEARGWRSAPVVYGRGSFDNKGPVAVAWLATVALARALEARGLRLNGTLATGFVIDEEDGMAGVRAFAGGEGCWLDRHGLLPAEVGPDGMRAGIGGVALDGSYGFVPVVGHRGIAQLVVRATGQAAHAATPDLGTNAVTIMASALHALASDQARVRATLDPLFADALLEPVTLAIGTTIAGGGVRAVAESAAGRTVERGGINVVPDWCEATIDCRHPRPADSDVSTIRERIAAAVEGLVNAAPGVPPGSVTVEVLGGGPPCAILADARSGETDPLVGPVLRNGAAVSGFLPWVETCPGGTDATVMINQAGIRSIVEFGPAGAFAHEPHEYVERDQIAVGAEILARTVADVLGVSPA